MHERALPGEVDGVPPAVGRDESLVGPDEPLVGHGVDPAQHAQELLAEHVPLTLLVDLLTPAAPTSEEILVEEGLPEQAWWDEPGEVDPASA